jgi:hypothetical protein
MYFVKVYTFWIRQSTFQFCKFLYSRRIYLLLVTLFHRLCAPYLYRLDGAMGPIAYDERGDVCPGPRAGSERAGSRAPARLNAPQLSDLTQAAQRAVSKVHVYGYTGTADRSVGCDQVESIMKAGNNLEGMRLSIEFCRDAPTMKICH